MALKEISSKDPNKAELFLSLWLTSKIVSVIGWIGTTLAVLGLLLAATGRGDFRSCIELLVVCLLLILGGGIVRVLIAIERNTRP